MSKNEKKHPVFDAELDDEEKELRDSVDRGEWKTVPNFEEFRKVAQQAAKNYFRQVKEKRISIRVFSGDLQRIKALAIEEGLPYQTLVTSVLHKFATGLLVDARSNVK